MPFLFIILLEVPVYFLLYTTVAEQSFYSLYSIHNISYVDEENLWFDSPLNVIGKGKNLLFNTKLHFILKERYIQWQGSTFHDQSPKNRETKPDIGSHTRSNRKNTTRTSEIQIKTFKILMQLIIYNLEQIRVKKHHQTE